MRHNCKGLARDGGIKARRILKFCPICPNFDVLVEDLPGHLRRVSEQLLYFLHSKLNDYYYFIGSSPGFGVEFEDKQKISPCAS